MKQSIFCLSSAVVCLFVSGCRTKLADQPLTSQQREWAEAMDRLNPKWRLPYHAPVRASHQAPSPAAGYATADAVHFSSLPPLATDDLSLPELPPVSSPVALPPTPGFDDVVLVPMSGDSRGAAAAGSQVHTVGKGETLSSIARLHYGKANDWRRIYDANRDRIDSPDRLKVGIELRIPAGQ